jgi:glycerate 2-kinase
LIETPKEDKYFERVTNILAVSNIRALTVMRMAAEKLGFHAEIRESELTGEASEVGQMVAGALHAAPVKSVLLWGGETTVMVRGGGKGGRNLEVAASALSSVRDGEEILSLASDGHDHGPYAGAICDTMTQKAAADAGIDPETFRAQSDTYGLFGKIGNYLMTGDTGSNVSDLIVALKE